MYCRINGALIWLVGRVCEREGVCLCGGWGGEPFIHQGVSEMERETEKKRERGRKSGAITDRT